MPDPSDGPARPTAPGPDEPPFVWRCARCLRREPFGPEQLRAFLRTGWPVCCGATVLCYPTESEPGRNPSAGG